MSDALITLSDGNVLQGQHVELLPSEAAILADYMRWLRKRDYQQKLYCSDCWQERTSRKVEPTQIGVSETGEIGIICTHKLTIYHGRVPLSHIAHPADDAKPAGLILAHLADSIPTVKLAHWEAELLRAYRDVLASRQYLEALYCGRCFGKGYADGCHASVTDTAIDIRCRCRHAIYRGLST